MHPEASLRSPPAWFSRASTVLWASVALLSLTALVPRAWLPPPALIWYGGALLAALSVINAGHIVASWQIFYRNPVIREREGKTYFVEFVLLPPLYFAAFTVAAAWFYRTQPGAEALLFLLAFDGPVFAHHVASQDRGFLTILGHGRSTKESARWLRAVFFPLMLLVMATAFSRSILLSPAIASHFGASVRIFPWLFPTAAVAGAALCLWASMRSWWERRSQAEAAYFLSVGAWCVANLLLLRGWGLPLALLTVHSLRHALLYLVLAETYFAGRAEAGADARESLRRFWLILVAATVPTSAVLFYVYLGLPQFWPELHRAWGPAWLEWAYPWLMGATGALLLHHYHIERHSWSFRDEKLGRHLRSHLKIPSS